MAIRKRGIARRVVGVARSSVTLRRAKAKGAIDEGTTRLANALTGSDLVVIATYPSQVIRVALRVAKLTQGGLLLTDVASTKGEIVRGLEGTLPARIAFVGGHPMAGSERSGIEASTASLFEDKLCILTPLYTTPRWALSQVKALWRGMGSRVTQMLPREHDEKVAQVSHLPHLVSATLLLIPSIDSLRVAGPGFSDVTRIALGDPKLWRDISLTNRKELLLSMEDFQVRLGELLDILHKNNRAALTHYLQRAQHRGKQLSHLFG